MVDSPTLHSKVSTVTTVFLLVKGVNRPIYIKWNLT